MAYLEQEPPLKPIIERLKNDDSITDDMINAFVDWLEDNELDHEALIDDIIDPEQSFLFDLCKDDFGNENLFDIFATLINQNNATNTEQKSQYNNDECSSLLNTRPPPPICIVKSVTDEQQTQDVGVNNIYTPNEHMLKEVIANLKHTVSPIMSDEQKIQHIINELKANISVTDDMIEKFTHWLKENGYDFETLLDDINDPKQSFVMDLCRNDFNNARFFDVFAQLIKGEKKASDYSCEANSIASCTKLKKMIQVLKFYNEQEQHISENPSVLVELMGKYPTLTADFAHISQYHLCCEDAKFDGDEFQHLYQRVSKSVTCNLKTCVNWQRNNRNRLKDEIKDQKAHYYKNLLDSIHVFFLHSYDSGYRSNSNNVMNDNKCDNGDEKNTFTDEEFKDMQANAKEVRSTLSEIVGNNKFVFEIEEQMDQNQHDKGGVATDVDQILYSYGFRCYYWKWYENNKNEDIYYHPTQSYGQWYVPNKWSNIKEEIINNPFVKLSMDNYDAAVTKADNFLQIQTIRELKSMSKVISTEANDCDKDLKYDINDGTPLQTNHLIALVCYTDFTNFSYTFSKSFRKISGMESDQEFKTRHSNYHFLSKYLRELVELYGTEIRRSNRKRYYTGISVTVQFPSFVARFCCPTSTTTELSVATIFAKENGVILTLTKNEKKGDSLRFFNVSYISAYKAECERLFVGGRQCINVLNIRTMANGHNFIHYVSAIQKFEALLSDMLDESKVCEHFDLKVVRDLIDHYMSIKKNVFPDYMNQIFASIMESKKSIRINVELEDQQADKFGTILLSEEDEGFVRIGYLAKFMINMEYVTLHSGHKMFQFGITKEYLNLLMGTLKVLSSSSFTSLKQIKILNVKKLFANRNNEEQNKIFQEFQQKIEKFDWGAVIEKRKEGWKGKSIPVLVLQRIDHDQ